MNREDLINRIIAEVKTKLNEANIDITTDLKDTVTNVMAMKNNKKALITYSPFQDDIDTLIDLLNTNGIDGIYINGQENHSKDFDFIIAPYISNDMLLNISNGIVKNCPTLKVISECFLHNKPVYFINGGIDLLKYKNTSNVNYYNKLYANLDAIGSFCSIFINIDDLIEKINTNASSTTNSYSSIENKDINNTTLLKKKLITEKDILDLKQKGFNQLKVEKGTIITALAKDIAKKLSIEIVK